MAECSLILRPPAILRLLTAVSLLQDVASPSSVQRSEGQNYEFVVPGKIRKFWYKLFPRQPAPLLRDMAGLDHIKVCCDAANPFRAINQACSNITNSL